MTTKRDNRVFSDLAIPPGEFLEEEIATIGMTQQELAERTGRPVQALNEIIRGKKVITHNTALELEKVLGIPAHVWVNMQAHYDLTNARIRELQELSEQIGWLDKFPVREIEKCGWIERYSSKTDKVRALLGFLGVRSFSIWEQTTQDLLGFRISAGSKVSLGSLAAWLRKGELEGQSIETHPYDENQFLEALNEIRGLTRQPPSVFVQEMEDLCSRAGVAVALVQELPKSGANGVARWLKNDKALIQLNIRGKWSDIFWFSFFHEACHVLKHQVRHVYIDGINGADDIEAEADRFAGDFLIPSAQWARLLTCRPYTSAGLKNFAKEIGVSDGIVVGRMQHEKLIPWNSPISSLKERFIWGD